MPSQIYCQLEPAQANYQVYTTEAYRRCNETQSHLNQHFTQAYAYTASHSPISSTSSLSPVSFTSTLSPESFVSSLSPGSAISSAGSRFPSPISVTENIDYTVTNSQHTSPASNESTPGFSRSSTPATSSPSSRPPTSEAKTTIKRGQPPDHIKRPANAYICFRSEFCKNKPPQLEKHNANVSIITGLAWKQLGKEGQRPYREMAERKKAEFLAMYPDWVFRPRQDLPPKKQRKKQIRTADDQERYLQVASEYNSGKRGKELQEYQAAGNNALTDCDLWSRSPRTRKSTSPKTKRLSSKAKAQLSAAKLLGSPASAIESTSQSQQAVFKVVPAFEPLHSPLALAPISPPSTQIPLLVQGYGDYHTDISQFLYDRSPVVTMQEFMADSLTEQYAQQGGTLDLGGDIYSIMSELRMESVQCPDGGILQPNGWTVYENYDYQMRSEYGF